MRGAEYDMPVEDTYEIVWELNDDVFIERIKTGTSKTYYQSHYNENREISFSLGEAMIKMGTLLITNKKGT